MNYHIGRLVLSSLCVGSLVRLVLGGVRFAGFSLQNEGNSSILPALKFHPAATREPDGLCGNQRYRRELLMIGIMVPETC